jgi:SAM-dependent methyltransferase
VSGPDPRERFSSLASLYAKFRPSYPPELFDWIVEEAGAEKGAPALDLGCGTGISTRLLAERGYEVVGVDPNEKMLDEARAQGGGPRYARGDSLATGLADRSVALATVAQAFHWFDIGPTLRELHRVLRPGSRAFAYWNVRAVNAGFMAEYDAALREWSREYHIIDKPLDTLAALRAATGVRDAQAGEFRFRQRFDFEGLIGRVYSSSYVVHGVEDHAAFKAALRKAFERHAQDGHVDFDYRTLALAFGLGFP